MFSKISDKILGLSDSYTFYKSEHARLNEKCELLEKDNASLRNEVKSLLEELKNKQDAMLDVCNTSKLSEENATLRNDINKQLEELNRKQEQIRDFCNTAELSEENTALRNDINKQLEELKIKQEQLRDFCNTKELREENVKIFEALMSNQEHFSRKMEENKKLLESLETYCMRVEKTSSYTNVKLDSKFDDNRRFIEDEVLSRLK